MQNHINQEVSYAYLLVTPSLSEINDHPFLGDKYSKDFEFDYSAVFLPEI